MTEAELLVRQATGPQFDAIDDHIKRLEQRIALLEAAIEALTRKPPPDDPTDPPAVDSGWDERGSD